MNTLDLLRDILKENQGIDPAEVTLDSTFDSLKIDSIDMVQLICELEDRMGIDFGEPEGIGNVEQLIAYLDGLQA